MICMAFSGTVGQFNWVLYLVPTIIISTLSSVGVAIEFMIILLIGIIFIFAGAGVHHMASGKMLRNLLIPAF